MSSLAAREYGFLNSTLESPELEKRRSKTKRFFWRTFDGSYHEKRGYPEIKSLVGHWLVQGDSWLNWSQRNRLVKGMAYSKLECRKIKRQCCWRRAEFYSNDWFTQIWSNKLTVKKGDLAGRVMFPEAVLVSASSLDWQAQIQILPMVVKNTLSVVPRKCHGSNWKKEFAANGSAFSGIWLGTRRWASVWALIILHGNWKVLSKLAERNWCSGDLPVMPSHSTMDWCQPLLRLLTYVRNEWGNQARAIPWFGRCTRHTSQGRV